MDSENLFNDISLLNKSKTWGTYALGQYYFRINTSREKNSLVWDEKGQLQKESLEKLYMENFPAIIHEYIHYLHELSTNIGTFIQSLDLCIRSDFSHFFDEALTSCKHKGLPPKSSWITRLSSLHASKEHIMGSSKDAVPGIIIEVSDISFSKEMIYVPDGTTLIEKDIEIPEVHFQMHYNNNYSKNKLRFGQFFLYEGLAYELDRELERQVRGEGEICDTAKGVDEEYLVMRKLGKKLCPQASKEALLVLGSLALGYIECGSAFVRMMTDLKTHLDSISDEKTFLDAKRIELRELLLNKRDDYFGNQDSIAEVFNGREQLSKAFSHLTGVQKNLYQLRIEYPTFEVDCILAGQYGRLFGFATLPDLVFQFDDADDFARDFYGSTQGEEISLAYQALASYAHYHAAHKFLPTETIESSHPINCPYYTNCNLEMRKNMPQTCGHRPWRAFEESILKNRTGKPEGNFCSYGQGVLEFKGHNRSI